MAYLGTTAAAVSNGNYGRGGCGEIELHWHNMPDATVELLPVNDIRGVIEIRWRLQPAHEGMFADLSIGEARALRDNLAAAIERLEPSISSVIDNEVSDTVPVNVDGTARALNNELIHCRHCGGRIVLVFNGADYWWTHEPHSVNDHEPVTQGTPCARCGGAIELLDDGIDLWWVHNTHPADGHEAVPGWTAAVSSDEEVA
ncbi:hypothetical protein VMT65_07565 [Nocardia sp. CDC153]|uniref:hypothetical protein n=1 Tax=Nocardia sp. CDC153 TaxID=3112167 RepID=UPI002DB694CA|nr:hypothetical protein [Nocardia sp. CDC153]MEC3952883.1 hypothetical protein [Nocardia sp. CDC153]